MAAQGCLLAGPAVLINAGAGQRELEKTCNKVQAGQCMLLTNHKTTLPQKCEGEGKVKDPSPVLVLSKGRHKELKRVKERQGEEKRGKEMKREERQKGGEVKTV